jgi:hypothetical protein
MPFVVEGLKALYSKEIMVSEVTTDTVHGYTLKHRLLRHAAIGVQLTAWCRYLMLISNPRSIHILIAIRNCRPMEITFAAGRQ